MESFRKRRKLGNVRETSVCRDIEEIDEFYDSRDFPQAGNKDFVTKKSRACEKKREIDISLAYEKASQHMPALCRIEYAGRIIFNLRSGLERS